MKTPLEEACEGCSSEERDAIYAACQNEVNEACRRLAGTVDRLSGQLEAARAEVKKLRNDDLAEEYRKGMLDSFAAHAATTREWHRAMRTIDHYQILVGRLIDSLADEACDAP